MAFGHAPHACNKLMANYREPLDPAGGDHLDHRHPLSSEGWSPITMTDPRWPLNNILPTNDNLYKKNIIENNLCPFMQPGTVATRAQANLSLFKETKQTCFKSAERTHWRVSTQNWKPPVWPYFKVNFDTTFDKAKGSMGLGIIIRDAGGSLQAVLTAFKDHISSAFYVESAALHRAMSFCIELDLNQVCFEGDAKVVVDAVTSKIEDNSWLGQVTEDMQQVIKCNQVWRLNFAHRSTNKAAHKATKLAIRDVIEDCLVRGLPS
ncbi:uncharacterized protein LOC121238102 [Juglans microcarpa x Juglans regia]|uniref:uncharacterized protein LOC121238102 n=1 Tax=Juglans microcarpa x Juglans regia TaxID=2249226 RepID=UPI001B7DE037|nr:uncharacterized protein LOC121238102 [Juglans microcarpa x Juglans regia]